CEGIMKIGRIALSAFVGVPIALLYGLLVRLTFTSDKPFSLALSTMTCGFLFIVPIAIGALTVRLAPNELRRSIPYAIFAPWVSIFIVAIASVAVYLEAAICVVMAIPLFMAFSSLGGYIVMATHKDKNGPSSFQNTMLGIILLAPYIVTPFEMRVPEYDSYRAVENQIIINAPANRVWENIISIPYINVENQDFSMFHSIGIPKLMEASLSHQGIGGVRIAKFDNGLSFVETVMSWNEFNSVSFSINPNQESPAPAPFNMVGGQYFAVTEMNYWIEETGNDKVILHLRSQHRVTTHFNSYAGIWTDLMLSNLQSYVLRMIKARAESSFQ
ncbi:MAG: hypothetical protein ACRD5H_13090, partial [Nitrososphaerales archaeon]